MRRLFRSSAFQTYRRFSPSIATTRATLAGIAEVVSMMFFDQLISQRELYLVVWIATLKMMEQAAQSTQFRDCGGAPLRPRISMKRSSPVPPTCRHILYRTFLAGSDGLLQHPFGNRIINHFEFQ
jgi:hypothetical protein